MNKQAQTSNKMTSLKKPTGRCLICRGIGHQLPKESTNPNPENFNQLKRYSDWTKSCVDSTCSLLGFHTSHPFKEFFLNANYCPDCTQLVRDIDFTLKGLKNFQKQILGFREDLFARFGENYEAVPEQYDVIARHHNKGKSKSKRRFTFDQVVKMVYEKIDGYSGRWTETDFMGINRTDTKQKIKIRNVLDIIESDDEEKSTEKCDPDEEKYETKSPSKRRRVQINYREIDGEEKDNDADTMDECLPTVDGQENKMSEDLDFNEDNDPDWRCSDAESLENQDENNDFDEFGPEIKIDSISSTAERNLFRCSFENCLRKFSSDTALLIHKRKVHEGHQKPYQCDLCKAEYRYRDSLKIHMKRHEEGQEQIQLVTCPEPECGRQMPSCNLMRHLARVHRIQRKCKICGIQFEKQEELDAHEISHKNREQPFQCSICDLRFTNSTILKRHTLSHDDNSPVCDVCGKRFGNVGALKFHRRIHDDSYEGNKCTVCGHKFQSASSLAQHMHRHSDEKKFVCEVCGAAFKYPSGLKLHKRKHDGVLPFVCQICNKGFIGAHYLQHHEETHSGWYSYECHICKKKFKTSNNLRQHVRIHEPKDPNRKKRLRKRKSEPLNLDSTNNEINTTIEDEEKLKKKNQRQDRGFIEREISMHIPKYETIEVQETDWVHRTSEEPYYSTPKLSAVNVDGVNTSDAEQTHSVSSVPSYQLLYNQNSETSGLIPSSSSSRYLSAATGTRGKYM